VGIICLTAENAKAPWIMFESGALAKNLDRSKVCPLLFGLEPTDVEGPLVQFQAARFDRDDVKRLLQMINTEIPDGGLSEDVLENVFDKWWPDLERDVRGVLDRSLPMRPAKERSDRDMIEEVLSLTRSLVQTHATQDVRSSSRRDARLVDPVRWPEFMRSAMELMASVSQEINGLGFDHPDFGKRLEQHIVDRGYEHDPHIQVCLLNEKREFVYHDWDHMIGNRGCHEGDDGIDIYDEIYRYPLGAVAWVDTSSNVSPERSAARRRFNIAVFSGVGKSGWRLVVEVHQDLRRGS
jgi:hypothetical protein